MPHTLMSSNIEDLIVHGVHESLLGRTFKDAVKVAHELGLRYLWIDSFCIIQDDSKDWLHESSQMHKVYGNSACNIAATSARDGSAGCFRRRNPSAIGPLKLEFANVEGRKTRVSSHMDEKHVSEDQDGNKILFLTDAEMWLSRFEQEPLNERAWVVQERMLSPRVLHYDRDQIAWECNQLTACERYPMGLGPLISKGSPLRRRLDPELRMAQEDEIPGFALQDIWKPVVEAYTLTAITKPIDRLIALYGVGIMIQEACGWEYVAGMFPGKNLVSQLLWRASGVGSAPRRPDKRIAPSWSWASIEGGASVMPQWREVGTGHDKVSAEELRETPFCRVTECMAPTSFDADDGRLSSHARLKLECYLLPMAFSRNNWAEMTMIKKWQRRNRDRQYNGNPNMDFCLTTDRNARKPKGGRTVKSTLQEILLNTLSLAMNRWTLSRRWFPFLEKWQKSTVHRPEKFAARIKYDVWDEFCDDSDLWLMPVYNFQHGVAYYFERLLYGSLEGLVLERGRIPKGDGTYETVFRRCGAFCVMPKKFDELGGFFYGREDVDNNMRSFWDGVLQFGDVTGVECVQSDGIYHPDFENWKEGIGTYKMRDNVPQYQITLV